MVAYLKIENSGVAPEEAFTLLGASTKRGSDNQATIGKFGTGNKHGVAVLLREKLAPVIFAGSLRMDFSTRVQPVNDGLKNTNFNRVVVKFSGKDRTGSSRTSTEDLGFVLEHGAEDWLEPELALREFVSNAIDREVEEGETVFMRQYLTPFIAQDEDYARRVAINGTPEFYAAKKAMEDYRAKSLDFQKVIVEVVNENQVRAKSGTTRIFVPMNDAVFRFYSNLDKWFLHFSEPELIHQTILPKKNRNLGNSSTAVIYRRGVRVREFQATDTPSLFDYNLDNLKLDESRKVDDWYVRYEAAQAIANAGSLDIAKLWQSFKDGFQYWEHSFDSYGLDRINSKEQRQVWADSFLKIFGEDTVLATENGGQHAVRKGYKVVNVPENFVKVGESCGVPTPATVLTDDEKEGRQVFDPTADADAAVEFVWDLAEKYRLTNDKQKPRVKTFRKVMSGGAQTLGYYKDGVVYINQDIAANTVWSSGYHGLSQQLLVTAMEEVVHHITGATDNSRDFQDYVLNLAIYMAKELRGIE